MSATLQRSGASWFEILCCLAVLPASAAVTLSLSASTNLHDRLGNVPAGACTPKFACLQGVGTVVPLILVVSTNISPYAVAVLALALAAQAYSRPRDRRRKWGDDATLLGLTVPKAKFISWFRGGVMLWTCLCILAVDFRGFHPRFAKASTYGLGIMDVGAGAIIFSGAIVQKASIPDARRLWKPAALAMLGLLRVAATQALGYHVDASEYGVHWNFFFTLAAVDLLYVGTSRFSQKACLVAGTLMLALHQAFLSLGGIGLAHSDVRGDSLWRANKEGLISLVGYCALSLHTRFQGRWTCAQLASTAECGRVVLPQGVSSASKSLVHLALSRNAFLWGLAWAIHSHIQPLSRRACNAAYIVWTMALGDSMLLIFAWLDVRTSLVEQQADVKTIRSKNTDCELDLNQAGLHDHMVRSEDASSLEQLTTLHQSDRLPMLTAVSDNQLSVFLVANVLTGIINGFMHPTAQGTLASLLILLCYMLLLVTVACLLQTRSIAIAARHERLQKCRGLPMSSERQVGNES